MAQNDVFLSQYFTSQTVRQRNSVGLINWAGYNATVPIPAEPTDEWIKVRIVAESIPISLESYIQQTLGYFMQDPSTKTNINALLSASNTDAQETSLSQQVEGVIGAFIQRFANTYVSQQQVTTWREQNGYELPPETLQGDALEAFQKKQQARKQDRQSALQKVWAAVKPGKN
jgi:hypothetical protein